MSHPHTTQASRDLLDDHGLVNDADQTEDLRPPQKNAPGRCWNTAEGLQNTQPCIERKF